MEYNVATIRGAGLEARWTRTRSGAPILAARNPGTRTWWVIEGAMWRDMQKDGVAEAFGNWTALGKYFSIAA